MHNVFQFNNQSCTLDGQWLFNWHLSSELNIRTKSCATQSVTQQGRSSCESGNMHPKFNQWISSFSHFPPRFWKGVMTCMLPVKTTVKVFFFLQTFYRQKCSKARTWKSEFCVVTVLPLSGSDTHSWTRGNKGKFLWVQSKLLPG